jgi:hypothetical protein
MRGGAHGGDERYVVVGRRNALLRKSWRFGSFGYISLPITVSSLQLFHSAYPSTGLTNTLQTCK